MKDFKKLIREAHLGNPLNEEDRATRVDKMLSGKYEDEDYKDSERYADVRADLEREEIEENEKFEKAARDEYGKPWMELSIAQKQELLSYMNRETEKQFQTDYERRRRETSDYMNEELDPKDFPANFFYGGKIYVFDRIAGGDRAVYYNPKYKGDNLVFGSKKQMEDYLDDYTEPKGDTQSSHFGTNEGTCGYGEDGIIGDKPAGAHLQKEDMNDPVLVKARAAKIADEKEKAKQAALNKKYGSSFMDKLDAEIGLKQELQNLKDEREDVLMRIEDIGVETEQTAEPEGGPIADELGERLMAAEKELRALDNKIIDVKDDLGFFDMNEIVNEEDRATRVDKMLSGEYEDEDYKDSKRYADVRADLEDEIGEEIETSLTSNEIGDELVGKEYASPAFESLYQSLKEKLNQRLGK
jgi:hypothetical protein